ncbi:DUF4321 domain-containing protein [Marinicrinis lubricantis]|uniref:DUF4321 domain-containing protein n=1 Tax=Marinicrinis lubricantis TaxID=2086470 RepID=A0ABW1ITJ3_9BACL
MTHKSTWTLILFLILGCLAGVIFTELLSSVTALSFLTKTAELSWQPKADFNLIKYDLFIQVKLNLISMITIAAAFWLHRKL